MRRSGTAVLVMICALAARPAGACQFPPEVDPNPECRLQAQLVVMTDRVQNGEPFDVLVTVTNSPPFGVTVPPFQHDRVFELTATGCVDLDGDGVCEAPVGCPLPDGSLVSGGASTAVDPERRMLLDDAWTVSGDDPSVGTELFTFVPDEPAATYTVLVDISVTLGLGQVVTCRLRACVPGDPDPAEDPVPTAMFEEPLQAGDGGSILPFSLRVNRNGLAPDRPLTVRVIPQNLFDPADLFPLSPPGLSTTGVTVVGSEEELVTFDCHLHFPCLVGAHNDYHVTIHEGPVLLWDSRWSGQPAARATVNRAPIPAIAFVGLENTSCSDHLLSCSEGTLHLRLFARNPVVGVDMKDVVLELDLPEGLSVVSSDFHFHDNPLDSYTPTPAELAATGVETIEPDLYRVQVERLTPRERRSDAPRMFRDLFEVELRLALPPGGLGPIGELVFDGFRVVGDIQGTDYEEVAAPLLLPVHDGTPPEVGSVSSPRPLTVGPDERLVWERCSGQPLEAFNVYRGTISELREGSSGTCLATGRRSSFLDDPERPEPGTTWFYLVNGDACTGEGTFGHDSLGNERASAAGCP